MSNVKEVDINEILKVIKSNLKRAKWDKEETQNYLIFTYYKSGILKLNDDELLEFTEFCKQLPDYSLLRLRALKLPKLPKSLQQLKAEIETEPRF